MSNQKLVNAIKDTIVEILEKQPGIPCLNPEFLEFISAPKPIITKEEVIEKLERKKAESQLFKLPVPEQPPEDFLLPLDVEGDLGDIFSDMQLLERAGVGFGKDETMRIYLAMKKLLFKPPDVVDPEKIKSVRFWGKILGTKKDYLVAECVIADRKERPPLPPDLDPKKVVPPDAVSSEPTDFLASANHFAYFVCSSSTTADWARLDDAQPGQVIAARRLRRLFTGHLDAPVGGGLPFPSLERHYLRAQIARIAHACRLAPRGHLADYTDPEAPPPAAGEPVPVGLSEEGKFLGLSGEQLCALSREAWVHAALDLLPQGRARYHNYGWAPPDDKPDAKDPRLQKNRPLLQSIHLDSAPGLGGPVWAAQLSGGLAPQFACALVRSRLWPGACAVGWGYAFVNLYIGDGQMCTGRMFAPDRCWPLAPEPAAGEYVKGSKSRADGVGGDLCLAPPPPADPTPPPA